MHVYFIRNSVQLSGQIFNRRLNKQHVRSAALRWPSVNLLGDLLERTCVGIDADVELLRVPARRLVHKATVSRPDVDDHSCAGIVG